MVVQGCPGSVLLVLADMSTWAHFVAKKAPRTSAGAYFDDRTLWARGEGCEKHLADAIEASWTYDVDAGWTWNHDKGQLFTTCDRAQQRFTQLPDVKPVGIFKDHLDLLGVKRNMSGEATNYRDKAFAKASRRMTRISTVVPTRTARDFARRAKLVRQVVLPCITWAGQWQTPARTVIAKVNNEVDRAINGDLMCRSPALARMLTGACCCPEFLIDYGAIRHQLWRATRQAKGLPINRVGSRLGEVCAKWGWAILPNFKFNTQEGVLDLKVDGAAAIWDTAERAWQRVELRRDERGKDSADLLKTHHPVLDAHRTRWRGTKRDRRAATASTQDWRAVKGILDKIGEPTHSIQCMCGIPFPNRRHWAHECTHLPQPRPEHTDRGAEHGLGIGYAPNMPKATQRTNRPQQGLVQLLTAMRLVSDDPVLIAFDGEWNDQPTSSSAALPGASP